MSTHVGIEEGALPSSLAAKLGSLIIHIQEATSEGGHRFDYEALRSAVKDPEVVAFVEAIPPILLPIRRRRS